MPYSIPAQKIFFVLLLLFLLAAVTGCDSFSTPDDPSPVAPQTPIAANETASPTETAATTAGRTTELYRVVKVVDGDTLDVEIDGVTERLRLIGINTPETVDPRKPIECFGIEASTRAKELLSGQTVSLEADSSQDNRDKYGRLLRYVYLYDGTNFNLAMIEDGYAYEYTYDLPYRYQADFRAAQESARNDARGLWSADTCGGDSSRGTPETTPTSLNPSTAVLTSSRPTNPPVTVDQPPTDQPCLIKGNISYSSREKIYHLPGCDSYSQTVIDEDAGERWFCNEAEALSAGWRKAVNCH